MAFSEGRSVEWLRRDVDFEKLLEHLKALYGERALLSDILPDIVEFLLKNSKEFRTNKVIRANFIMSAIEYLKARGYDIQMDMKRCVEPDVARKVDKLFRKRIHGWSIRHTYEVLLGLLRKNGIEAYLRQKGKKWHIVFAEEKKEKNGKKEKEEASEKEAGRVQDISVGRFFERLRKIGEKSFKAEAKEVEFYGGVDRKEVQREIRLRCKEISGKLSIPAIKRKPRR